MTESTYGVVLDYRPDVDRIYAWGPFADHAAAARFAEFATAETDPARVLSWAEAQAIPGVRLLDPVAELLTWRTSIALTQGADADRLRADLQRIQRWATTTVHGSAAAEVLLLIRNLPNAPVWNCFTDEAYRSSLTDSPERPCDRVQAHPAHKHVAQRASWQCPGVVVPSV